ncbi:MAG: helix-turn-helix domain-containing protein [Planctomycetota bacterium]|jgi:hypothetical protein
MAGMFYSLEEAIAKLNVTEEQLKELTREGKLREFRDGSNVLFKVDEIEALMPEASAAVPEATPVTPQEETDKDEISLVPEATAPETAELDTALPEAIEDTTAGDELADADTVIAEQGINVLGETDSDQAIEDEKVETKGSTAEASLEEIEEDVNLDTFGSGSGLLDLSLQADDTSLGGILDEIYTSESGEGEETRESSALDVAVEAEQMLPEEEFAAPEPVSEAPIAAQRYIELEPDTISNAFGIMLFLPLLVIVYTAIVTVAGFNNAMPVIRERIQDIIWYVMIGVGVAAALIIGVAFMLAGGGGEPKKKPKAKKPKKAKKKKQKAAAKG